MKNLPKKIIVLTSKDVDIQLHTAKWNTYYSSTPVLSTTGACCYKKNTVLSSTFQRNVSAVLCSQQWTQEGKVTKLHTEVSAQKQ